MKNIFWTVGILLVFFFSVTEALELQPKGKTQNTPDARIDNINPYVPDEILVRYESPQDVAGVAGEVGLPELHGWPAKKKLRVINTTVFKLPRGMDVPTALDLLKGDPRVIYAEPNYYAQPLESPNDPSFSVQWGLNNTGQAVGGETGVPDADIDGPEAWSMNTGSGNIIIAVIDTGVDIFHPDIRPNLWVNEGELGGVDVLEAWKPNGVDDDGNGYVDDIVGWDFFFDVNNPNDELSGHGTHVAGIAAARGNNGVGVTGVSWEAKIMALAAQNYASGQLPVDAIVDALIYAESMGAHVINLSLGLYRDSQTLREAINSVTQAVIVCAAGNDGTDNDIRHHFPSGYPNVNIISVTATNQSDHRELYSNYGLSSVDVAAPGSRIYSTYSRFVDPGGYRFQDGTSMAAPMVSGLVALIRAANGNLNPVEIVSTIKSSVDKLPSLNNLISTGGRINAQHALQTSGAKRDDDDGCFIKSLLIFSDR